jgi:ATP-dependent DNA helicase RecG
MAAATSRLATDASPGALVAARAYLDEAGEHELSAVASDEELLRRLGLLRSDGHLTQAGSLLFCRAERPLVTLAVFDVVGGDVINTYRGSANQSLLEQVRELETRLESVNRILPIPRGFVEGQVRMLPPRAVREAILNGLVHRDWMDHEPTDVVWVEADSRLQVVSPGGFPGEINANNVLTQRDARYPALSDAFRALLLVDKQGVGVDRMYREMIALGHRPPEIIEIDGPRVRCLLNGGDPVMPVVELMSAIVPEVRRRDVRIALIIFALLHQAFITVEQAARLLQTSEADALSALEAAAETRIGNEPLLRTHHDAWIFGTGVRALLNAALAGKPGRAGGLFVYDHPKNAESTRAVILEWLASHDRISAGDYAALAGVSNPSASRTLKGFDGDLLERRGPASGRNAHFVRRQA